MKGGDSLPVSFNSIYCESFMPEDWLTSRLSALAQYQEVLEGTSDQKGELTGWVSFPDTVALSHLSQIKRIAGTIRSECDVLVVIGIGGSYLGARSVLELLRSPNYNLLCHDSPQIFFAGNHLSPDAYHDLLALIEGKRVAVNIISRSGGTIEPVATFSLLQNYLKKRYSHDELQKRIIVTTQANENPLHRMALDENYEVCPMPSNVGGRYSVLTAAGILPFAVAGIDIDAMLKGASEMRRTLSQNRPDNPAFQYAAARQALYKEGKQVELLTSYHPYFTSFGEWWKQLFGETEGKNGMGLFPATAQFPTDLHSLGQYVQDGQKLLFETCVVFENKTESSHIIPPSMDELSFLEGHTLDFASKQAFRGTLLAHVDGDVPNLLITLSKPTAQSIGSLLYFFQYSCALSAYLLGVSPFDQPAVEAYKNNILALLGKPGLEDQKESLSRRFCRI